MNQMHKVTSYFPSCFTTKTTEVKCFTAKAHGRKHTIQYIIKTSYCETCYLNQYS